MSTRPEKIKEALQQGRDLYNDIEETAKGDHDKKVDTTDGITFLMWQFKHPKL